MNEDAEIQFRQAVARERFLRDAAFCKGRDGKPLTESIGGFEVLPMTLRDYISLRIIDCPFICGGTATPDDAANFLWALSADYSPGNLAAKARIFARCRRYAMPEPPLIHLTWLMLRWEKRCQRALERFDILLREIKLFVDETVMDRPPTSISRGTSYFSEAAGVIDAIADEYLWTPDVILDMPLKQTFQYLKIIRAKNAAKTGNPRPMFNPSDALKPLLSEEALNRN